MTECTHLLRAHGIGRGRGAGHGGGEAGADLLLLQQLLAGGGGRGGGRLAVLPPDVDAWLRGGLVLPPPVGPAQLELVETGGRRRGSLKRAGQLGSES